MDPNWESLLPQIYEDFYKDYGLQPFDGQWIEWTRNLPDSAWTLSKIPGRPPEKEGILILIILGYLKFFSSKDAFDDIISDFAGQAKTKSSYRFGTNECLSQQLEQYLGNIVSNL